MNPIPQDQRHDRDGQPYYHYFEPETQTSFIWSGRFTDFIQVCAGADGEPVTDQISPTGGSMQAAVDKGFMPTAQGWLTYFKAICDYWLITHLPAQEENHG